ncbi:hypothetical protein KUCAC02_003700 [Chaenocephalus aceratus]|uniref:Uncharacterized protein n=1 Tax=Chaenocephalus aceratus TaxID=36190 RepID=A0ACB9WLE4_CHAAC|nr:hypothetical protein KUCAC02_003700 [Chaenocephalus aceratus]
MAASQKFLLRVYIATDVAIKVTLTERPESVEELINILREKVKPKLDFEFTLQYEDPDFGGQLSCLLDIQELPEKGTLKVVTSDSDISSCASSDTDILPHVSVRERQKTWPDIFPVPTFSYEVEHVLGEGNSAFETYGKTLKLNRGQKHNILESMAAVMHNFKPYPSDRDVGMAAEALVTAHPCLKELGSVSGWYGWKIFLKFKMGNYRTKLARSGCVEVAVNAGKRSINNPDKDHPHSKIKRARRAEVNYLPNFPRGENQTSLEEMRIQILQEVEKSEKNLILIEKLMQMTFALRRQEIVQENPLVRDFLEKWPALRMESQEVQDVHMKRNAALRALPLYLREEDPEFFKSWSAEEVDRPDITNTPVAIVSMVTEGTPSEVDLSPASTAILVEGDFVISNIPRMADSFALLFGLMYVLHLDYPKKLINTFTFIQKVLMGLDDGKPLKPCLLNLKNDLLLRE